MAVSKEDIKMAKSVGFKKKAPKKPKKITENSGKTYLAKYREWEKECKRYASEGRKLDKLKKAVHKTRHYH